MGKPCRIPPCFWLGRVPGGGPLGPPLHLDEGGGWWRDGRLFVRCARAHRSTGKEKIPAVSGNPPRRGLHGGRRYSRRLVGRISDRRSWSPESRVTEEGLAEAIGRIEARKAPGPDGVPACLWKVVVGVLGPRLLRLFDRCLSRGDFPVLWKERRVVLLQKPGRSPDSPSTFQPVCLLERVVAVCLESHLSRSVPGLHDSQFGIRRGRSTAKVVARVRSQVEGAERRGYVALAVSLDVVNAFNSIPWDRICWALEFDRVTAGCGASVPPGSEYRLHRILCWIRCCGASRTTLYSGRR